MDLVSSRQDHYFDELALGGLPVAVGTRSRDVISSFGRTVEIDVEVIGLVDQQLLELRVDSGAFSGTVSYRLARRDALTVLTVTSDTEFKGIYRLSAPLIAPRLQTKLDEDLAALKRLAESHVLDDKP